MKTHRTLLWAVGVCVALAASAGADVFDMGPGLTSVEFVTIGLPGNNDSAHDGFGGVADWYDIGRYEVTAGQYTEFLNAVAATDD